MGSRPKLWSVFVLFAVLLAAPAAAINYGTAQGTVLAGGERFELTHAYAVHRGSVYETGGGGEKTLTILRLTSGEIAADAVADDAKFAKAVAAAGLHAVEIHLKDETGEVLSQSLYHGGKTIDGAGGEAATWLRGEYTNKVIWGAASTEGVQPMGSDGFWRYEAFFAAQFEAPPAAGLDDNRAQGAFKLAGKSAKLTHSRAWMENKTPEGGPEETYTVVLLSSGPVDLATARDEAKLAAAVKKAKLQAFKVRIHDQEGTLKEQAWYTPGGVTASEPQEGLRWSSWEFTTDRIMGFVTSDGERGTGKGKWSVDGHFNAPIEAPAAQE